MNKRFLTLLFITSTLLLGCSSDENLNSGQQSGRFGGFGGFGQTRITSVETQPVTLGPIAEQVKSFGNVKAQNVVQVIPQVSNRITRIYVDLGDTVRAGQVLAKINDTTFRDQLNQATAQVNQARIALQRDSTQYERIKSLYDRGLSSDSELQTAEATYESSRAQYRSALASLTQARENFDFTEVKSPVHGVIVSRNFEEGDLASQGQALFEVANTTGYESRIYLPVQDWRVVKIGQEVSLRVSNEENATATGIVARKSPQLDPTTGLGEVVITLTGTGPSIYPGVLVENIINIETKERAITVPRSALVEKVETVVNPESNTIELERSYSVFVAVGDSLAERRELELGIEQGDRIEVLSGLRPGEHIIVTGQQGLEDGSRIAVATGQQFQAPQQRTIEPANRPQGGRPGGGARGNMPNLTDEQRQQLQNMTPEERRAFIQQLRQQDADSTSSN